MGQFEVSATIRSAIAAPRQRTLATGLPNALAAAELAEDFIARERPAVMNIKRKDAPWRQKSVSPNQRAMLEMYKIPYVKTMTSGEASELIDLVKARRGK